MNFKTAWKVCLVALAMVFVGAVSARAQVVTGSISGTVVDQTGAVVPGVQVTATNRGTNAQTKTTSDAAGLFRFSLMPVGTYDVQFAKAGFTSTKVAGVEVGSNIDRGLGQVKLQVGSQGVTTVEVSAAAPLIEATQAQVSQSFSSTDLTTFPGISEAEGLDNLALTLPGVSNSRDNSFSNSNGPDFSVNGIRSRNNDQQIDGQNNNDNSVAGPGLFVVNPDFVQEYVVTTNNFGPEYGRNSGSAVNEVTKSGTNVWHGTLFGTETNSVLQTLTNVQKNVQGLTRVPRFNNEFSGGSIGGPIWKNHVFVFSGLDTNLISSTSVDTGGATPTPFGVSELAGCFPSSASVKALASFGPFGVGGGNPTATPIGSVALEGATNPNGSLGGTPVCNVELGDVTRTLATPFHQYDWVQKFDAVISDNDRFSGRYLFQKQRSFGDASSGYPINVPALSQDFLLDETHTFSSRMVNEWRGSFSRLNVEFGGNTIGNTVPVASQINQALARISFGVGSNLQSIGPATNLPQQRIVNTWQTQDNWSFIQGKNQWKAGVNFTYQRTPNTFLPFINGAYTFGKFVNRNASTFNSQGGCSVGAGATLGSQTIPFQGAQARDLNTFACNIPTAVSVAEGNAVLDYREYDTFLYAGDDLKATNTLTLNLGLTWSYYGQPANLFNTLTVRNQTGPNPLFNPGLPLSITTDPKIPTIKNSFGPGVGFAWTPRWGGWLTGGDQSKTVIRGGFRMTYDPPFYNIYLNQSTSAPLVLLQTITAVGANPNPAANQPLPAVPTGPNVRGALTTSGALALGVFDPRSFNETNITPNFGPDRVRQWSLGIQRQVTKNAVAEVRYVGNHGYDLFQTINANPFVGGLAANFPALLPAGVTPCAASAIPGVPTGVPSPALGRANCNEGLLRQRTNTGFSDYNGVQTELRSNRLFNQLTLRTNFTWSKTTDNVSEIFATGGAGNTLALSQNPLNFTSAEHGLSGLNFPKTFTVTAWEELPFFRSQHGVIGHILGGWVGSATYILQSGQGYTPIQFSLNTGSQPSGYVSVFDAPFDSVFSGFNGLPETARPFVGSLSAPVTSVGIFAADACNNLLVACGNPATDLIDFGSVNSGGPVNLVTKNQVRYIVNGVEADNIFGTPFGNAERNFERDTSTNLPSISIYKNIRFSERTNLQFHTTLTNAFNHPNLGSIDPFIDDAGFDLLAFGAGFGQSNVTGSTPRVIYFGLKVTF